MSCRTPHEPEHSKQQIGENGSNDSEFTSVKHGIDDKSLRRHLLRCASGGIAAAMLTSFSQNSSSGGVTCEGQPQQKLLLPALNAWRACAFSCARCEEKGCACNKKAEELQVLTRHAGISRGSLYANTSSPRKKQSMLRGGGEISSKICCAVTSINS